MKAPRTIVLTARQHPPTHQPDPALDRAIAKHRGRLSARLALVAPTAHARAEMGKHLRSRYTNTIRRGFRS
jgi:hypothetical protein